MASTAKHAFADAKAYVDLQKDPATFSMIAGLYLLAEQMERMENDLDRLRREVADLRRG